MKYIRIVFLVYLSLSCLPFINLDFPVFGSYILMKVAFFSFAESLYLGLIIILAIFIVFCTMLFKKKRLYDISILIFFLIDFIYSFSTSIIDHNYISTQSMVFDLLFLGLLLVKGDTLKRKSDL